MPKLLTPRERILNERGLATHRATPKRTKQLRPAIKVSIGAERKTILMLYLEQKYKAPIEDVLVSGSLNVVAKKFNNEVDRTTLSRWIKRFKLRYNAGNLPSCDDCRQYGLACQEGVCYVLLNLGLYELVPIKKREVMNG